MFMNFGYNKSYYFILHDEHLIEKILDPSYLDEWLAHSVASKTYFKNQQPKQKHGLVRQEGLTTVATILCLMHLSTASGIWIQLGMSAVYDTRTYCRQSLVGGNYGLLNTTTFVPNPDYYRYPTLSSTLLWTISF
ncbi:hypothetical protein HN51_052086 [Arachis hypogaea]